MELSVAIIVRNEEERLPGCLESIRFVDEVLVVDSESTDKTIDVARSYGAKVIIKKWGGYSKQKQFAVDHCSHRWVLILDADERIPTETAEIIKSKVESQESDVSAFSFRRKNFLHGKWIRHCGWWPDRVVRLVDKGRGCLDGRPVHERWVTNGKICDLDATIEHISFKDYSQLVAKMERYSFLASEELFKQGVKVRVTTPLSHGLWMFFKTYVVETGFVEGFDGFIISLMNAGGSFLKYAKLREKWEQTGKKNGPLLM